MKNFLFFLIEFLQLEQNQNQSVYYIKSKNKKQKYQFHSGNSNKQLILKLMGKVRRQPKRTTKKLNQPKMKNIFIDQNVQKNIVPKQIVNNLVKFQLLSIQTLDQVIPQPLAHQIDLNLQLMKSAVSSQYKFVEEISKKSISNLNLNSVNDFKRFTNQLFTSDTLQSPIRFGSLLLEQPREQTKKTTNTHHSDIDDIHHLLNQNYHPNQQEKDNYFYDLGESPLQKKINPDEFIQLEDHDHYKNIGGINDNQEIDFYTFQKLI